MHLTRKRVVVRREGGTGHVRLLFIGEAPGQLEDAVGVPFVGAAGTVLHQLFKHAHYQFRYLITNTVCCRPVDVLFLDDKEQEMVENPDAPTVSEWEISSKVKEAYAASKQPEFSLDKYILDQDYELYNWNREPVKSEMDLCRPHIDELVISYQPHGIVYLGKVAMSYKPPMAAAPTPAKNCPRCDGHGIVQVHTATIQRGQYDYKEVPCGCVKIRKLPTLALHHPAYIKRLEYKLLPLLKEARKLDQFVESLQ